MNRHTILVVDDEPENLALMKQILDGEYALVFARNGDEALVAAGKHQPALVLTDVQMPGMDGYELCRRLKENPAAEMIPVIFVSTLSHVGNEAEGFSAGGVDYIVKPVSPPVVQARVRTHLSLIKATRLEESYREAIHMLGEAGHYNDSDTGVHVWRMASFARALATAVGWDEESCRLIELAAPMHDTGKIGIPDSILRKRGALDPGEWETMKTHTRIGYSILARSRAPVFRMAAEIALRHHEKWDGSGYPDGLAGEVIPESARIVALADVFDALTMKRPYKDAWSIERTMETMRDSSGTHFEPRLLTAFDAILPQILKLRAMWNAHDIESQS